MKKIFLFIILCFVFFNIQTKADTKVRFFFFYSPGCQECQYVLKNVIPPLDKKYPLEIKYFNVDNMDNYDYMVRMEKKFKVTPKDYPEIFIGEFFISSKEDTKKYLEDKVKFYHNKGGVDWPDDGIIQNISTTKEALVERFKDFKLPMIISAGLLDGINPCSFATIVFLVSFLAFIGRKKWEILLVGIVYTLTEFVTYTLIGLGILKALRSFAFFPLFSSIMYIIVGIVALLLGGFSLYDFWKALKGRTKDITLQLPRTIKKSIHAVIREHITSRSIIIAGVVSGFLVTLLESICTGQIYIPTLLYMFQTSHHRWQALSYLLTYNVMFVLPEFLVFIVVFVGVSSDRIQKLFAKNLAIIKLLTALLFFTLAALVIVPIFF